MKHAIKLENIKTLYYLQVEFPAVTVCNQNRVNCDNLLGIMCQCLNVTYGCDEDIRSLNKIANFGSCFKEPNGDAIIPSCCNDLENDINNCKNDTEGCSEKEIKDLEDKYCLLQCDTDKCVIKEQEAKDGTEQILQKKVRRKREFDDGGRDSGPCPQGPPPHGRPPPFGDPCSPNQEDWQVEPPPESIQKEWEFIDEYMSLSRELRKDIGHSFQDFVKSCIFRGKNCTNET